MRGNFLSKTAVQNAVFQGDYEAVVGFEIVQKCLVQTACKPWIDERGLESELFLDGGCGLFAFLVKIAKGNDCHFFALLLHLVGVEVGK